MYCLRIFTCTSHVFFHAAISVLEVFIKPEVANLTDLSPVFHLNTSVGESWQKGMIPITVQNYPFQVYLLSIVFFEVMSKPFPIHLFVCFGFSAVPTVFQLFNPLPDNKF